MKKNKKISQGMLCKYARLKIGVGYRPDTSLYDLVCEALEKDGIPAPMGTSHRSWTFYNQEHIQEQIKGVKNLKFAPKKQLTPNLPSTPPVASNKFLESFEWRRLRMQAIKKYGSKCMCCGATPKEGAVMNVDHIKPRKLFPNLALDITNLQILCHECNHGKGNWDQTDWRKNI